MGKFIGVRRRPHAHEKENSPRKKAGGTMKRHLRPRRLTTSLLFVGMASSLFLFGNSTKAADETEGNAKKKNTSFNHLFDIRNIEGWTVYINKRELPEHADVMNAAIEHMQQQLYEVRLNVPAPAVAIMQQNVPLWVEYDTIGIAYHGRGWLVANGYKPPDQETLVGFCRAKTFLDNALHQPWVVFHELAHGYDHRYVRKSPHVGHELMRSAYDDAMAAGKYDPVLCRYSKGTKAYGANNPGEFFSENSEAFFGANDFYPFVRAELKEYDPETYRALQIVWGVDIDALQQSEQSLVALMDANPSPLGWAGSVAEEDGAKECDGSYPPTSAYQDRRIEGWTVKLAPALHARKAYADEICKLLRLKLHLVKRYVPEQAVPALQEVPIWLEANDPAVPYLVYHDDNVYHDDRRSLSRGGLNPDKRLNPDKHRAVEIGNTDNFRRWQNLQPSAVLHHLARAWFDRTAGPDDKKKVVAAYQKAVKSGRYDDVLRFDGKHVRHPALLSPEAYFAELSESYYGFNDHYPFLQFELAEFDPDACELLSQLWGGKAK